MRLDFPLDSVLSSPARVKCLRLLSRFPSKEFTGREMGALARASPPQAIQALRDLEALGLVRQRRAGSSTLWRLRPEHVLAPQLRSLFDRERTLRQDLVETLRAGLPARGVCRAVLYGSVAHGGEEARSDIDLYVEVEDRARKRAIQPDLDRLATSIYERFGAPLSILVYSKEEARTPRNPRLMASIDSEGIVVREG